MATHYLAATSCGAAFCILASIFFFSPGGPVGRMAVLYLNTDVKVFKCRFTFLLFASIHTVAYHSSLDGAGKLATGYAVIEGHPNLK